MSEADQRQKIIQILKPLNAVSVENLVGAGTPDVNYGGVYEGVRYEGWIELKWEKHWPKRGGPLRVPHYTTQQKVWARRRCHRGGACHLLLQVGRDWILLDGEVAATLPLGEKNREELMEAAIGVWNTPPERGSIIQCLLPKVK